jgi:hypothetical protein
VLTGSGPPPACPNDPTDTTCPDVAAEDLYGGLAWGSLGVGVAGVAGGLIWFFMNRGSAQSAPRASLTGSMLPGGGTLGLRYAF